METILPVPSSAPFAEKEANTQVSLPVTGMTCAACAVSVESMVASTPGVSQANVNFATQTLQVSYRPKEVRLTDMQKAVRYACERSSRRPHLP